MVQEVPGRSLARSVSLARGHTVAHRDNDNVSHESNPRKCLASIESATNFFSIWILLLGASLTNEYPRDGIAI